MQGRKATGLYAIAGLPWERQPGFFFINAKGDSRGLNGKYAVRWRLVDTS